MINIKVFDFRLLKIDKNSYKNIDSNNIECITIKKIDDYDNIHSVYTLYLMIGKAVGHIAKKDESKNLVLDWKQRSIKEIQRTLGWD